MTPTAAERDSWILNGIQRTTALAGLALIAATWRLWTPQTVFPQVPFAGWAVGAPPWWDWLGLGALIAGLLAAVIAPHTSRAGRTGLVAWIAGAILLVLLDQHRLQPWAWQFLLIAVVLATVPPRRTVFLLQVLTISIYGHSALSKLDAGFFDTHGQTLLAGLMNNLSVDVWHWPPEVRKFLAAAFPVGELAVAAGLAVPRWRRMGLYGSLLMHVLLLATVGPWGLNHKPGVLLWNVFFLVQNVLLFGMPHQWNASAAVVGGTDDLPAGSSVPRWIGEIVLWGAVVLPLLEPFGLFDHWPAWGLYASRPERVAVYIHEVRRGDVADDLPQHITQPPLDSPWCRLRLGRWSLDALDAPVYPQDRFQLGVALAVARRYDLGPHIRVVIQSPADRWTGRRTVQEFIGVEAIAGRARQFHLNAEPRW